MTMELTWSLDYCMACDKQTSGETYCSQSCRLADLETSTNWSSSSSPATPGASPAWTSSESNRGSGFYLSPAINFAAYKVPETRLDTSSKPQSVQPSYFSSTASNQTNPSRILTPSSSRSSLSSTQSSSSQTNALSEQARTELRSYTNCFDDSRNWRRRKTWA